MEDLTKMFPEHLKHIITQNVPLAKYTTYKIGGDAELFAEPESIEQLREIVSILKQKNIKTKILGGGSNLLISDDLIPDAIISLRKLKGFKITGNTVEVSAGENLASVIKKTTRVGFSGLEILAGIPGTVGGALIMNAGGKYGNISDHLQSVQVLTQNNEIIELRRDEIEFCVRKSSLSQHIVLSAQFLLTSGNAEDLEIRRNDILDEKVGSQPYNFPSAGCVFKNPPNSSAGLLIDRAGMKGFRVGGAIVSNQHANFILNEENAKASEIIQVIRHVRQKVREMHGIELELEIKLWNLSIQGDQNGSEQNHEL